MTGTGDAQSLANIPLFQPISPPKIRPLIAATGFDGAYIRFTGNIVLEKYVNDELVETIKDSALWERMYLGKTIEN